MSLNLRQLLLYTVLTLTIGGLFLGLVLYPIYGADIYYVFYPSAKAILEGRSYLYQPGGTDGFFNPAHAMYYWLILALTPLPVANALHMLLSMAFVFGMAQIWREFVNWRLVFLVLAITNLHMIDHLVRGQMDILAVFGLIVAFAGAKKHQPQLLGLGLSLTMMKPTNLVLALLLVLWALRKWSWRELLYASFIPSLLLLSTFFVFDFEWPLRFLRTAGFPELTQANLTIWKLADAAQIPILIPQVISGLLLLGLLKHRELSADNFALALAINFIVTPYAAGYHYVALIPALLCIRSSKWLLFCCLLSVLAILRGVNYDYSWLALLYPIAICMGLLWQAPVDKQGANLETANQAAELSAAA